MPLRKKTTFSVLSRFTPRYQYGAYRKGASTGMIVPTRKDMRAYGKRVSLVARTLFKPTSNLGFTAGPLFDLFYNVKKQKLAKSYRSKQAKLFYSGTMAGRFGTSTVPNQGGYRLSPYARLDAAIQKQSKVGHDYRTAAAVRRIAHSYRHVPVSKVVRTAAAAAAAATTDHMRAHARAPPPPPPAAYTGSSVKDFSQRPRAIPVPGSLSSLAAEAARRAVERQERMAARRAAEDLPPSMVRE